MKRIFHQEKKGYDSSVRIRALHLILDTNPTQDEVKDIVRETTDPDNTEFNRFVQTILFNRMQDNVELKWVDPWCYYSTNPIWKFEFGRWHTTFQICVGGLMLCSVHVYFEIMFSVCDTRTDIRDPILGYMYMYHWQELSLQLAVLHVTQQPVCSCRNVLFWTPVVIKCLEDLQKKVKRSKKKC